MKVIGVGTYGFVVDEVTRLCDSPDGSLVFKISTDAENHKKEVDNASMLRGIDPAQRYFIYPIETACYDGPLPQDLPQPPRGLLQKFDRDADVFFVDTLVNGGTTLKALANEGRKMIPLESAGKMINNLLDGLDLLHRNRVAHLDVQPHNVLVEFERGSTSARLIDFGCMTHGDNCTQSERTKDVKDVVGIMKMILHMTDVDRIQSTQYALFHKNSKNPNHYGSIASIKMDLSTSKEKENTTPSPKHKAGTKRLVFESPSPERGRQGTRLFNTPSPKRTRA